MTKTFDELKIATQMKCDECESLCHTYLDTKYLDNLGLIEEDKKFTNQLLIDLEEHIREKHPERAKAFLKE